MHSLARARARRRLAGRIGCLCLALAFLMVLDGLIGSRGQYDTTLRGMPGETVNLSGSAPPQLESLDRIGLEPPPTGVDFRLTNVTAGYWMGGKVWTAEARIATDARPGDYPLTLSFPLDDGTAHRSAYTVRVMADAAQMRRESSYVTLRHIGLHPFWGAGFLGALGLAGLGLTFLLSNAIEALLEQRRMAEVYRFSRDEQGFEMTFGLGREHGLTPGGRVLLVDESMNPVAAAVVETVGQGRATARAAADSKARPGLYAQTV